MTGKLATGTIAAAAVALLAGLGLGLALNRGKQPPAPAPAQAWRFEPRSTDGLPPGPDSEAIRRGEQLFIRTSQVAARYVGSSLNCSNCHLEGGTRANAAPMWAAWGMYPAYREKNGLINTMEDRIRECFIYSMNAQASPAGAAPPRGDPIYLDMQSYFAWLAKGAPVGTVLKGRGYPKLAEGASPPDRTRGAALYEQRCAMCHGAQGQGQPNPDGTYAVPPLWGPHSFNWGAGMGKIANAAGFIKANMPLGQGNTLSDSQAWDLAVFMDGHERPRDPRQAGQSIEQTRQRHHAKGDFYGQTIDGDLLGDGVAK